jgi:hypothetical protein
MNILATCKEYEIINCTIGRTCPQCTDWHRTNTATQYLILFLNSQDKPYKNIARNCKQIQPNTQRYSNPCTDLDRPWGFQEVEAPRFNDSQHKKVARLSVLRTGRLYPPGNIPGTHFCWRLSWPQSHSEVKRIMSMKNSNDTTGSQTRDLQVCSTVPQPTAPPCAPRFNRTSTDK